MNQVLMLTANFSEYFICGVRLKYMKLHEIFQLDMFDVRDGKAVRSIRGCLADGNITELYVNMVGKFKKN